jgi:hypothetical protein
MWSVTATSGTPASTAACRLIVRKEEALIASRQFVTAGLDAGQQVFAMGGPAVLKELAYRLSQSGLRPETFLHSRRLVFLTVPDCLATLTKPGDPFKRGRFPHNGSLVRWVADWSWACGGRNDLRVALNFQRRIHEFLQPMAAVSLCTVDGEKMERASLLALLADHRRSVKVHCS